MKLQENRPMTCANKRFLMIDGIIIKRNNIFWNVRFKLAKHMH